MLRPSVDYVKRDYRAGTDDGHTDRGAAARDD